MDLLAWNSRDALLLAFAELGGYGIVTVAGADGTPGQAHREIGAALRARAPHGLGSYVFWLRADEHHFADGGTPPLHTSGREVDRALAAALRDQGFDAAA